MKFKGIELKGTYKTRYYSTSFAVYDGKGNAIYCEDSDGYWEKSYFENSNGYWERSYFENSNGKIIDKRVKELTIEEVEKLLGYKIKIKGERNESNKKRNK